ncbi:MAG: hypothetical protein NZM37_05290 [Sandaracinaceae bacterium]|nr:hypothetical protein [Sandaracinaceae bacterium]MDW8246765.1 hypothetical protein [Sandaracinaceae bacterium]
MEPAHARIYTDERFLASARVAALQPIVLSPGKWRFTVVAHGHFPHDFETELRPGLTTIRLRLRPIPP